MIYEIKYKRRAQRGGGTRTVRVVASSPEEATAEAKIRYEDFLVEVSVEGVPPLTPDTLSQLMSEYRIGTIRELSLLSGVNISRIYSWPKRGLSKQSVTILTLFFEVKRLEREVEAIMGEIARLEQALGRATLDRMQQKD